MGEFQKDQSPEIDLITYNYQFAISLMQFLVVPAFVLNSNGVVLIWNKACERLTGFCASEIVGTRHHWKGFYEKYRPLLADLILQNKTEDIGKLYMEFDDPSNSKYGLHAENWCLMPRFGVERYLYIDAGPIFDIDGKLLAVVQSLRDMTDQKRTQLELEILAVHDALTGLINRRGFDNALNSIWHKASDSGDSIALLMIDVDHFKKFNDAYGHSIGDECLRGIASVLSHATLRSTDIVARYGGEEFVVILPCSEKSFAEGVASRILKAVSNLKIPQIPDGDQTVTVSIGVAVILSEPKSTPQKLIDMADSALYQAKRYGRNRFVIYNSEEL